MTEDLQRRRWRLFLEQYASDYGDGWQSDLAGRIDLTPSAISKQAAGIRGPARKTIQLAVERLRISPEYFSAPWLGESPHYRDHMRRAGAAAPGQPAPPSPHWRRFIDLGGPDRYGLTDEQIEWLRSAPFRGGAQSVDDYLAAAEMIARLHMREPDGMAEAKARRARRDGDGEN